MSNKRIVNFTTCVRNSSIYDDRVIKLLIGFVPTEDECESLSMEQLRNTELATREKEHANEIINYLKDIEANYPGIMFDEPVLAYYGVLSILMDVNFLECSSSIFVAPTQCPMEKI